MAAVMPERARENAVASSVYRMRDKGSLASSSVPAQEDEGAAAAAADRERVLLAEQTRKRKYSPIIWDMGPKRVPLEVAEHGSVTAATPPQAAPNRVSVSPDADQQKLGSEAPAALVEPEELRGAPGPEASASFSGSRWTEALSSEKTREFSSAEVHSEPPQSLEGNEANGNSGSRQSSGGEEQYEQDSNDKEVRDSGDEPCYTEEDSEDELLRTPKRHIDMLKGCRNVDEFERLNRIDEGTYGVVYRARERKTGQIVALKKVKMDTEREGFPMTSLREINVLLSFHHPSIVDVKEVVVGSNLDSIFMVMEYMEHDLKSLMEAMRQPFSQSEVKCLMLQLFQGVAYLHRNWVIHRDLKTSNLLLNNRGELKICDFGMARQYGSPLKTYTRMVVTLWYRAPELLLGSRRYDSAVDMWSLGCIMAEFLAKEPLFSGKSELDQLDKIFKTLGTPNERIWPGFVNLPGVRCNFIRQPYNRLREKFPPLAFGGRPALSEKGYDLLNKLLTYDPEKRISAEEALNHEWFREVPLPKMKELMPTFPARSEQDRRLRRLARSPDPLEEQRKRELRQAEFGAGGVFG